MALSPEEYKSTREEHGSTPEEFRCSSTGGWGGGADIICNSPFGTFPYSQDPSLLQGRFLGRQATPPPPPPTAVCCGKERCARAQKAAGFA